MADAFRIQQADLKMKDVSFDDRIGMLVDVEYTSRKNNRLKRLIKGSGLEQPDASVTDIDYTSGRKLNKQLILRLATCEYITEYRNIFITGATGSGKTYMACAFGMEACKQYYTTKYVRLPDLLIDLEIAREDGNYENERKDIFELLHHRRKRSSTIFCSQYRPEGWYEQLGGGDGPLADAILDRIMHDSYKINIESFDSSKDLSMREVYGLDKSLAE